MDLKLHANATTPRTRAYIQRSRATNATLARELGIHSRTVARWKARQEVTDRSTRPHRLNTSLTELEEALVVELPHGSSPWAEGLRNLALPLDDIVEAMRRCINPALSRSAIHLCLQRHGISARLTPEKAPAVAFHTDTPAGFIHVNVKYLPPLNRRRSYAYVAIDRATRFVYLEILPDRRADTAAGFLARFRDSFPLKVHTILTDNGFAFTDRFAVDKKGRLWLHLRDNRPSLGVFRTTREIIDSGCAAWNWLLAETGRIRSPCSYPGSDVSMIIVVPNNLCTPCFKKILKKQSVMIRDRYGNY